MVIRTVKKYESKVNQRVEFAKSAKVSLKNPFQGSKLPGLIQSGLARLYHLVSTFISASITLIRESNRPKLFKAGLIGAAVLVGLIFLNSIRLVFFAQTPIIKIDKPSPGELIRNENLYVSGSVEPVNAQVTVSGKNAAINGDGSFTAVVEIPPGEFTLEVSARYWFKKAQVLIAVRRVISDAELQKRKKYEETLNILDEIERESHIRVTEKDLVVQGRNAKVVGEVTNFSQKRIFDIQITATFVNADGATVDTKYAEASGFNDSLAPGESAQFETTRTPSDFITYKLDLGWEESP